MTERRLRPIIDLTIIKHVLNDIRAIIDYLKTKRLSKYDNKETAYIVSAYHFLCGKGIGGRIMILPENSDDDFE